MMINRPTSMGSILIAVLLVLMPAQPLLASVAVLNVQPGAGGKPTAHSVIKDTVIGERFEASPKEILEVLLSDGTSLTLGPGAALVIESFTYDPKTQSGQLNVRLERGQFRVAGGLLNNTGNIAVQTPSGKLDLDNASVFVDVQADGATRASLLHGKSLKMTTNGKSETVERPAFEVVAAGANQPLKSASHQDPKMVAADALALNSQSLLDQDGGGGVGDPGGQGSLVLSSLSATGSETPFTTNTPTINSTTSGSGNTESGVGSGGSTGSGGTGTGGGGTGGGFTRSGLINVGLNPSEGFGPGPAINAADYSGEQPSQANDDKRSLAQNRDSVNDNTAPFSENTRELGRTTNRLFNSTSAFNQILDKEKPIIILDKQPNLSDSSDERLQYVFFDDEDFEGPNRLSLAIDRSADLTESHLLDTNSGSYSTTAPFLLLGIDLPARNNIFAKGIPSDTQVDFDGFGSIFKTATYFEILQAGFSNHKTNSGDANLVKRDADNFFLVQVRPGQIDRRRRDQLKEDFQIDQGGSVKNPELFIKALDPNNALNLDLTTDEINSLAAVILNQNIAAGAPVTRSELDALKFLEDAEDPSFVRSVILGVVNEVLLVSPDPKRTERYIFATGDVDNRLKSTFQKQFSVDKFFISAGLENFEQKDQEGKTVADGIRAFLRNETGLNLTLEDTGLLVVNPGPESSATKSTLLHADFGLQGTGSDQQSTISVTIGNVDYKIMSCDTCDTKKSVEVIVDGQTIGSSRGSFEKVNQDGSKTFVERATVGFSSPLRSTAAGGGNPSLKNPDGSIRDGYAGYFVFENYDPEPQGGEKPISGGTEKPLGGSGNDQGYAYLRLATATGSSKPTLRTESTLNGWMGGLAEFQNGSGGIDLTQIDSGDLPDNVEINTSPTNNTVEAKFNLRGQDENQFTTFNLGGLDVNGSSAFVDDNRFAARSTNSGYEVVMVSADLFRNPNGNLPPSLNMPPPLDQPNGPSIPIPQYEHLKWGFFFGDTKNTGQREHVHLGTWIAGKIPTGDSLGLKGTATYSGHSIGNVFNNGSVYTAVGSFNNQWNFDSRAGTVQMDFDNTKYNGTTAIKGSTFNFNGNLNAPGRQGGLQGSFVAPVNPTPAAVMGGFAIAETPGSATYRAAGTFGAERK